MSNPLLSCMKEMLLSFVHCCHNTSSYDFKMIHNVFILGVDLPVNHGYHEIVASKDNKYLYAIGNYNSPNDIYRFTCTNSITNCSWTKIETKLQYGRRDTVAIPLPDSIANKLKLKFCH